LVVGLAQSPFKEKTGSQDIIVLCRHGPISIYSGWFEQHFAQVIALPVVIHKIYS
jgi:hypothetical protein